MKVFKLSKIKWDTDGVKVKLPKTVILVACSKDFDVFTEGADSLSDRYGYCVFTFKIDEISSSSAPVIVQQ